ncbi:UNVERIFIED_CONTAM: hypothetical protein FKN15_014629 [Acipenser sinensis]
MADSWQECMELGISIARNAGKTEFGIVYSCKEDKMYTARKGKGAFLNGVKLNVSGQTDITKSLVITEVGPERDPKILKTLFTNLEKLLNIPIHGFRAVGTAATDVCFVAAGEADAYYHIGLHCWDIAAAGIIVTEAGGVLMDTDGGPFDMMCRRIIAASSRAVGEAVAKHIRAFPCVIVRNCVLLYFSFIGEESVAAGESSILTDNPTWIIDPIDGTTNFVHRFPFVAVSIGFAVKKELEFGVVYSCMEDKMYTARKGKGAFCNGVQLKVSGQEDITKSLIITELGSNRNPDTVKRVLANMDRLLCVPVHGIRAVGTAAVNMCLVATGGADAYYEIGIHCWDMAAAAVIVTEAGGVVMDVTGGPFDLMSRRLITASSRAIGERIAKELQAFPCERDDGKKDD